MLGVTGSGKSSLISFLNGAKFTVKKVNTNYHMDVEAPTNKHPKIGNSAESCTYIPGIFGDYIDSAGFLDSNGPIREIINSYATMKLFEKEH